MSIILVCYLVHVCLCSAAHRTQTGLKCLSKYDVIKLPPPTSTLNDDIVGKEGWGDENVSQSDGAILVCSLTLKSTQNIKQKNQNWTTLSAEKCTEGKSNFGPVDPSCKRTVPVSPPHCSIQTMASLDVEYIKKVSLSRYSTILPPRYSTSSGKNLVENNNCL